MALFPWKIVQSLQKSVFFLNWGHWLFNGNFLKRKSFSSILSAVSLTSLCRVDCKCHLGYLRFFQVKYLKTFETHQDFWSKTIIISIARPFFRHWNIKHKYFWRQLFQICLSITGDRGIVAGCILNCMIIWLYCHICERDAFEDHNKTG